MRLLHIGTIGFYIPGEDIIELPNTTPNILDLYELLLLAKEKESDKGFKDALIWESLKEYKKKNVKDTIVLYSKDKRIVDIFLQHLHNQFRLHLKLSN